MNGRGDGVATEDRECHTRARPTRMTIPLQIRPVGTLPPALRLLLPVPLGERRAHAPAVLTALTSPPDSRIRDHYKVQLLDQVAETFQAFRSAVVD